MKERKNPEEERKREKGVSFITDKGKEGIYYCTLFVSIRHHKKRNKPNGQNAVCNYIALPIS